MNGEMNNQAAADLRPKDGMEQGHEREDTYFLPAGLLPGGMKVEAGDVLEFKVVGQSKDGEVEVEYNHDEKENEGMAGIGSDLRQNVNQGGMENY